MAARRVRTGARRPAEGQVDREVAEARTAVRGRPDWRAPALFSRLREGRLRATAGHGGRFLAQSPQRGV